VPLPDHRQVRPARDEYKPEPEWVDKLAWLMDNAIPLGGKFSIGLDGLIGLIPGFGDLAGALISVAIVLQAQRAGIPRATVLRMVANIGIDAVIGSVPILGDMFDFTFKANTRNLQLYREAARGQRDHRKDQAFLVFVAIVLMLAIAVPIAVLVWVITSVRFPAW
jgi:hypothetical protein